MAVEKAAGQQGHVLSPMGASVEMPRWQCHKIVWALQIEAIHRDADVALRHGRGSDGSAMLVPADRKFGPIHVDLGFMAKHQPVEGGFYVVYDDGYTSFSPLKAFEAGYSLVDGRAIAQRRSFPGPDDGRCPRPGCESTRYVVDTTTGVGNCGKCGANWVSGELADVG